ncbi:MAG: type II toxin-antitoxin system VapC family toxin [Kineosporiaceae bacterium]|jgi:predicted nucleic acid-binding protein
MPWYLDTSAFLKLAVREDRSDEMRTWADAEEERSGALWSSDLLRTEALRAARRVSAEALAAVRDRMDRLALITITTDTHQRAGELDPAVLRSLDAVHLAAALRLGDDLDGVVTYDERMAAATRALGLAVISP